ncbi:hypothetical protein, partial [Thermococcus sp.]|uniref:hypothetical protein n=1 Tax=Thermococcus sp. TaxID=35749 RepID=UPI002609D1B4
KNPPNFPTFLPYLQKKAQKADIGAGRFEAGGTNGGPIEDSKGGGSNPPLKGLVLRKSCTRF